MKRIAYIIAAIAAVAAVGCQKFENEAPTQTRTLVCSFDATKTTLDGNSPKWAVGDEIKLIDATGSQVVTLTTENIKNDNSRIEIETGLSGETIYAVYPASAAVSESVTNDIVEFTTAGQDGTFAKANICVAKEDNGTLSFKNATAIVNIKNANTAHYFNLTAESGYLNGEMSADFSEGLNISAPESGETSFSKGKDYKIDEDTSSNKQIETCDIINDYYIAIPAGNQYSFVAKKFTKGSGQNSKKIASVSTSGPKSTLTAERNKIYKITISF